MRKKKDLPLTILKSLEPFVNLKGDKFEVVDPKEKLLKVIDKDVDSVFHFTIHKYEKANNGNYQFLMTRAPKSEHDNGNYQATVDISTLGPQFEHWLNLLNQYENTISFFDDPIVEEFYTEFYTEFEFIDNEDAEKKPFSTKQILLLDNYLEAVENKLLEFTTPENEEEIIEIKENILLLRENLTTQSKKWVVSKLTQIWAKIAKQGVSFIKEFLTESKKELIKQGIKGILDFVNDNGHHLLQ